MSTGVKQFVAVGLAILLASAAVCVSVFAAEPTVKTVKGDPESFERDVDRAAMGAQTVALTKLKKLVEKYRNTEQEAPLLDRLADVHQQSASIYFRLAHAGAHKKNRPINLKNFGDEMRASIETLDRLISKFPTYDNIEHMYFMRGKAYEEIENKVAAEKDYLHLVKNYPNSPEAIPAYMSLAEFAIGASNYALAASYLHPIEQKPENPHYPFAIYKLAWAYYNLQNTQKAIGYLESHIRYYDKLGGEDGQLSSSDLAIRETSQSDVTLFYLQGYEQKESRFSIEEALPYFKKLADTNARGKMYLRFAKLLRAHTHEEDLLKWKDMMIATEAHTPESVDVLVVAFEYQAGKNNFEGIKGSAFDLVKLYHLNRDNIKKSESYAALQKLLLDSAKNLRDLTIKNKNATRVGDISATLASVYDAFIKIVDEKDPRIPGVHYNLAETLFEIKDYAGATEHYRWIVQNWQNQKSAVSVMDASLKALASRYEVLRQKNLIPTQLAAQPFEKEESDKVNGLLVQWIRWIDKHVETYKKPDTVVENFIFEGNRALYAQNKVQLAVKRLIKFAEKYEKSKYAVPSATLALDTYIKSMNWTDAHSLATQFMKIKSWQKTPFADTLFTIAADSYFKRIENIYNSGNREETLDMAEEFTKKYSKSPRLEDLLFVAGKAAMDLNRSVEAEKYFAQLIASFPNSENTGPALLTKTSFEEKRYDFAKAALGYVNYLKLPLTTTHAKEDQIEELKKKILLLQWLSGDVAKLKASLTEKDFCIKDIAEQCDAYSALAALAQPNAADGANAFKNATNGFSLNRPIWAAVVLENQDQLAFPDRMLLVRIIAGKWDDMDALHQFAILPALSTSIARAFEQNRFAIQKFARVKADEKAIQRRVALIKEMEETAAKVMKLPWSRIRAGVMNEIAQVYLDFSNSLNGINAPQGLSEEELASYQKTITSLAVPFEEKAQEIRTKAFEISSKFAVEDSTSQAILVPFFRDQPSVAQSYQGELSVKNAIPISFATLEHLDPNGDWNDLQSSLPDYAEHPADYLKALWVRALKNKNWAQVAFFNREARDAQDIEKKKLLEKGPVGLMRAVSLAAAGAQAEGLAELKSIRDELKKPQKNRATVLLISHYLKSLHREQTKELIEELQAHNQKNEIMDSLQNEDEAFTVVYGADWSKAEIADITRRNLLEEATGSSVKEQGQWAKKVLASQKKDVPKPESKT